MATQMVRGNGEEISSFWPNEWLLQKGRENDQRRRENEEKVKER